MFMRVTNGTPSIDIDKIEIEGKRAIKMTREQVGDYLFAQHIPAPVGVGLNHGIEILGKWRRQWGMDPYTGAQK